MVANARMKAMVQKMLAVMEASCIHLSVVFWEVW